MILSARRLAELERVQRELVQANPTDNKVGCSFLYPLCTILPFRAVDNKVGRVSFITSHLSNLSDEYLSSFFSFFTDLELQTHKLRNSFSIQLDD